MSTLPVFNPTLPYLGLIPGGLQHGKMIRINGVMNHGDMRFNINIQTGAALKPRDNVNLHISVRPSDSAIVRNHYENFNWGVEERFGSCPIQRRQEFDLLILAEYSDFKIAINGTHFCKFNHRLPLNLAQFISIEGDVTIRSIKLEGDFPSAPPMPYPPSQHPIHRPIQVYPPVGGIAVMPPITGPSYRPPGGVAVMPPIHGAPPPYTSGPTYPYPYHTYPGSGPATPYTANQLQNQTYASPAYNPNTDLYPNQYYPNPNAIATEQIASNTQYYANNQEYLKKQKRNTALKYAAGIGGVGLGAYVLSQAFSGNDGCDCDSD